MRFSGSAATVAMSRLDPLRLSQAQQLLLAFAFGGLAVLAFAPFELGVIALLVMAPLLHLLWHAPSAGMAARIGYAFGLGLMGFGVFWLRISIAQFGGVPPALAYAITLLFVLLMAAYFALFAALAVWLRGNSRAVWMLAVAPACWFLVEWLRGWLFTGFPWLSFGYSQLDLPLAGYAPLLGVFGVGLLLLLSAGLLNLWRRLWPPVLLLVLWVGGLALSWIEWTEPAGEPFEVSLVQGNIPQYEKWRSDRFVSNLQLYMDLSQQAPDSRLLIWPETAIAGFAADLEEGVLQLLHEYYAQQGRDLLTGVVTGSRDSDYYNAMISLGVSGRDAYHKRHLVPFSEYLPFKPVLGPVLDFIHIPMSDFTHGDDSPPLVELAGYTAGVDICYEDAFAAEVMRALPQAHFLVNASNDGWFGDSLAPHQHLQIARMRSLESGRVMLRATNTGVSAVIDARGEVQASAPQFQRAVLTERIQPRQGDTPYSQMGEWPLLAFALPVLAWAAWRRQG